MDSNDDEFERLRRAYDQPIIVDSYIESLTVQPTLSPAIPKPPKPSVLITGKISTALPTPQQTEDDPYAPKYTGDDPYEDQPVNETLNQRIESIVNDTFPKFRDELDQFTLEAEVINCTVKLSKEQGDLLKDLINELYDHTFPRYCMKVGISTPNFYNTVNGERPCSLEFLNKLLSGIGYTATMSSLEVLIQEVENVEIKSSSDASEPGISESDI